MYYVSEYFYTFLFKVCVRDRYWILSNLFFFFASNWTVMSFLFGFIDVIYVNRFSNFLSLDFFSGAFLDYGLVFFLNNCWLLFTCIYCNLFSSAIMFRSGYQSMLALWNISGSFLSFAVFWNSCYHMGIICSLKFWKNTHLRMTLAASHKCWCM